MLADLEWLMVTIVSPMVYIAQLGVSFNAENGGITTAKMRPNIRDAWGIQTPLDK